MSRVTNKDLIGQTFGRLTITDIVDKERCNTICSCGQDKLILIKSLKKGATKSCGCFRREKMQRIKNDLTGKVFGRLTVVSKAPKQSRDTDWNVQCECGKVFVTRASYLTSGDTKSCGCLYKERRKKFKDLIGQKFGKLTIISKAQTEKSYIAWNVLCACGNAVIVRGADMKNGKIRSCGCLHKELMMGDKNPNWQGGFYLETRPLRETPEYKLWRIMVYKRDNFTCQECGCKSGKSKKIHAHHIKSFSLYPELRFDITNGVTLCKECHEKTETYGRGKKK